MAAWEGPHSGLTGAMRRPGSGLWVTLCPPLLCSVLESDPQFGFEEAKKKLQGRVGCPGLVSPAGIRAGLGAARGRARALATGRAQLSSALCPAERPWLVDSYSKWLQRLKVPELPTPSVLCSRAQETGPWAGFTGGEAEQGWAQSCPQVGARASSQAPEECPGAPESLPAPAQTASTCRPLPALSLAPAGPAVAQPQSKVL